MIAEGADVPTAAAGGGEETEGIKARLTKALHAERTASNTLHVDCWACEAVQSDAVYVEVWDSYHPGRKDALVEVHAKIDRHITEAVGRILADRVRQSEAEARAALDGTQ